MTVKTSGPISMSELANEFGGAAPLSMSQYYRNRGRVLNITSNGVNNRVPESGPLSMSNFYTTTRGVNFGYEIVAGGGGGGGGANDPIGAGVYGGPGGNSAIYVNGTIFVSVGGGAMGVSFGADRGANGNGASSAYGGGGAGGGDNQPGQSASAYGAGGGGGGGDAPSYSDKSGPRGLGGGAGAYTNGNWVLAAGSVLYIAIGGGSAYDHAPGYYDGGRGANGFARLYFSGRIVDFTSSGSITIT